MHYIFAPTPYIIRNILPQKWCIPTHPQFLSSGVDEGAQSP